MTRPIVLSGAEVVLADRTLSPGSLVIEGDRIVEVTSGARPASHGVDHVDLTGHVVVPGFIDVHVHGLDGIDLLASADGVAEVARRLPRFGVTAFCPTSLACSPEALTSLFEALARAQHAPEIGAARVLAAHLESNFINPDFRGAQPLECIRRPPHLGTDGRVATRADDVDTEPIEQGFTGADIFACLEAHRAEVGIVTIAPEMPRALDLIRSLVASGHRVSLGHSGASFDQAMAGVDAGARHATHLFNRMTPVGHREPGLSGAVLRSDLLAAEIICDGHHVHPAMVHTAIRAKRPSRMMAITDGTAGSGLPVGTRTRIGNRAITVTAAAAYLDDGTLAGSTLTMDGAFRMLVGQGFSLIDAAAMCATTQASELGLTGQGRISTGSLADLAILDGDLHVVRTYVGGHAPFGNPINPPPV